MKNSARLLFTFLCVLLNRAITGGTPVQTVPKVNLTRYAGDWYEVARTPNRYEKSCTSDVTVHYRLEANGSIAVRNECRHSDGKLEFANGKAHVAEETSNAKLRVSFFWPFAYDYWIIGLDGQYGWAVVGEPNRKDLWILSRTAQLQRADYQLAVKAAAEQGYDVSRIVRTPQTGAIILTSPGPRHEQSASNPSR